MYLNLILVLYKILDISQNNFVNSNGFAHIDKSLEFNTSLRTLETSNNFCTTSRQEAVKAIHKTRKQKGLCCIDIIY